MILLDTSALIEFLNRTGSPWDTAVETLLTSDADVAIADIALTEVLQGIRSERDYRRPEQRGQPLTRDMSYVKG